MLDWQYYHNSLRDWIAAAAVLAAIVIVLATARQVLTRRLGRASAGVGGVDSPRPLLASLVRRTRYFFLLAIAIAAASLELVLPPRAETAVRAFAIVAVLLQIAVWGDELVAFALRAYMSRRSTPSGEDAAANAESRATLDVLSVIARGVLWVLILLVALDSLGIRVTTLIAGLGVTGVALALAVQNILGDLFAALAIILDKPFVVGDWIAVDTLSGSVDHIGLKTTRVRALAGEQIVFSNADLLKSRVRNFRRIRERTVVLALTLDPSTPPDRAAQVPEILRGVITGQPGVRFDRSHVTRPSDYGLATETVYTVLTPDYIEYMDAQQAVTIGALRALNDAGIKIATPGVSVVRV
jgi:small-conductance mechanosensitive channel